jgi:hypothetical protein
MNTPEPVIFEAKTNAGVMQDKYPPGRITTGIVESSTVMPPADIRPKHHGSETRQTQQIAGRVPPHVKSEVVRLAKLKGWTESYTVNTLVQQALAHNLAESFGVMLKNTIQESITKQMNKAMHQLTTYSRECLNAAEEGRVIGIYNLRYLLGEDNDLLSNILKEAQNEAGNSLNHFAGKEAENPPLWQSSG